MKDMKEDAPEFENGDFVKVTKKGELFGASFTPSVILHNPKYPHNVGAAVRACSNFGAKIVLFTGDRVSLEPDKLKGYRLPREERMKDYQDIILLNDQYPFNRFGKYVIPVAVEVRENAEPLTTFIHPPYAVYVFGPEDGSIPQVMLRHCQRFIVIPSKHCLNLGASVNVILYDRISKMGVVNRHDF
jgi:tRNA(Leu) C34 or U34 (ribose-2'-O)-methylase TrmL